MSHYMLLVELPSEAGATESRLDMLERALKPWYSDCDHGYSEAEWEASGDEPGPPRCGHKGHEWDWWELGGRYVDFFQSIPSPSEAPMRGQSVYERSGRTDIVNGVAVKPEPREGYDLIRKRDVDWEAMAARRMKQAAGWWDEYQRVIEERPRDSFARYQYGVEEGEDRDAYIVRRTKDRTYAVLTADGRWVERETFVYVPDGESRFDTLPDWDRVWDELAAGMPAEAVLAIVDIHN